MKKSQRFALIIAIMLLFDCLFITYFDFYTVFNKKNPPTFTLMVTSKEDENSLVYNGKIRQNSSEIFCKDFCSKTYKGLFYHFDTKWINENGNERIIGADFYIFGNFVSGFIE